MTQEKKICWVCGITSEDEELDGTFVKILTVDEVDVCEGCDDRIECQVCATRFAENDIEACSACGIHCCPGCTGDLPVRSHESFCKKCIAKAKEAFERVLGQPIF